MPALDLERHVIPARQTRNKCRVSVPNEFDLVFEVAPPVVLSTRPATPRPSCTTTLGATTRTTRLGTGYILDIEEIAARIHVAFFYETAKPFTARYLCVRPIDAESINRQPFLACHALCSPFLATRRGCCGNHQFLGWWCCCRCCCGWRCAARNGSVAKLSAIGLCGHADPARQALCQVLLAALLLLLLLWPLAAHDLGDRAFFTILFSSQSCLACEALGHVFFAAYPCATRDEYPLVFSAILANSQARFAGQALCYWFATTKRRIRQTSLYRGSNAHV
mmetsp:Transcript_129847/g.259017  ORF Transcript_129847/g.259017 Transcript_129847/m.259017 type:complete len:279 (+) Transcript_129847:134-970(+)